MHIFFFINMFANPDTLAFNLNRVGCMQNLSGDEKFKMQFSRRGMVTIAVIAVSQMAPGVVEPSQTIIALGAIPAARQTQADTVLAHVFRLSVDRVGDRGLIDGIEQPEFDSGLNG